MSDTSGGESSGAKKKSFSSRFSKKMHHAFKRGSSSSSSDDDDDSKSHRKAARPKTGLSNIMPPIPGSFSLPGKKPSPLPQPAAQPAPTAAAPATAAPPPATTPAPAVPPRLSAPVPAKQSSPPPVKPAASPSAAAAAGAGVAGAKPAVTKPREVVSGPAYGAPEIVLTGVKGDPDVAMKNLRSRGFVVHLAMQHEDTVPPTMTMVLAMGPKLLMKSAVERNLPTKARADYTSGEVSQLCADAVRVIQRSAVEYDEVNLLHDKPALEGVANAPYRDTPEVVFSYFGPYIGLYFAWLTFYTKALLFPTALGACLFLDQWRTGSPDSPFLPIFCVLIMVWSALFLDLWRRRNSSIAFRWGVDGMEDEELMRISAAKEGEFKPDPAGKLCVTGPIILAAIYAVIRAMLYCIWLSDHAVEVYGADSYMQYFPLLLYSIVPLVASTLYTFLAKALNDFEEHTTAVRKKNMLVIKMFAFQFVNSYCGLLYVGFWLRDLKRLRTLLMTMMMVKQFVSQFVEMYQPVVMRWMKDRNEKKNPPKKPVFLVKRTGTIEVEELLDEMKAEPADVEDDYLEMVLQFGYVSMFAVVFPLAPLFAMMNNIWEFKVDIELLVKTRRPQAHAEATIGAWQVCLEMIGIVACLTNLLLAVLVSENVSLYVPTSMTEQLGSFEGKVVLVVVIEHVMFLFKAISSGLIDKVPRVVREAQAIIAIQQKKERREFRRMASGLPPSSAGVAPKEETVGDRLRELHETHDVWKFGPVWYLPLAFVPFLVAWFELSAWLVLPVAFVYVSYLQHQKDLSDKALAIGVVKDPKVLQLVTGFLPLWYKDSEVERVEWMNKILKKMWVAASGATDDLFSTTIQPILDSYRPPGISALGFRKVSLGTIPPKIVGVRALEMKGDKAVIDIDIRWAANAVFVLEAGVKPVPLLVTLDKICFAGRLRVELAPLVPRFPCFGAIALTFMEEPFIDFNFAMGKLEVMSIGPGQMNVGNLVGDTIKDIVKGLMLFPVKMPIPILDDQDILGLSHATPTGVVQLTVVGADKLRSADITGKSDPYVKVKLGKEQKVKTGIKKNTLNPRFNETFDLMVYERSVELIKFEVYDRDSGPGDDDSLGVCEMPLSVLTADVESSLNLPLSKTTTGSLLLTATYVPLSSGAKRLEEPDDDIMVDVPGDEITDEMVIGDVYQNISADGKVVPPAKPAKVPASDPSELTPRSVVTDTSLGVITVMGIECKGVKPGDRYVSVVYGNVKRKTAVVQDMSNFSCKETFHFLVKGAKSAVVEVLLKEEETIGSDKCLGSFKVSVAEVMANDDTLHGEWDLAGEKAKGSIKMRFKWAGRVGDGPC